MSDENQLPNVQGTDVAAEPQGNVSNGVQTRIDELTARYRDIERSAAEKDAQIAALLQMQLAQTQQAQVQTQPPPVEIDPDRKREMDAYFGQVVSPLQKELQQLRQQVVSQEFQSFQNQVPAEVVKMAQDLKLNWQRNGYTGWRAEDAITFAYGEYAKKQALQGQANQQRQVYNQQSQNVNMQSAPPPSVQAASALPANINSLPLQERLRIQEEYFAKNADALDDW